MRVCEHFTIPLYMAALQKLYRAGCRPGKAERMLSSKGRTVSSAFRANK
jgi:hypothetical protein